MKEENASAEVLQSFLDMSMAGTLPTLAEADNILSRFLPGDTDPIIRSTQVKQSVSQWRNMVLKSLSYGCMKKGLSLNEADGSEYSPSRRVEQTVHFLTNALRAFRQKMFEDMHGQDTCPPAAAHSPERIMVDAIWFVATVLYRDPSMNVTGTDHPTGGDATQIHVEQNLTSEASRTHSSSSYILLCRILNGIVMGFEKSNDLASASQGCTTIPLSLLLAGLEPMHLASAGILSDSTSHPTLTRSSMTRDHFIKQFSKYITNLYYKQTNTNLMIQEETEGYAKLLCLLSGLPTIIQNASSSDVDTYAPSNGNRIYGDGYECFTLKGSIQDVKNRLHGTVLEIISTFHLAPIRVLDLTLDALESHILSLDTDRPWTDQLDRCRIKSIAVQLLVDIVMMYPCENVAHLLGFKLWSYASSTGPLLVASTHSQNGVIDGPKNTDIGTVSNSNTALDMDATKTAETVSSNNAKSPPQSLYTTCALLISYGVPLLEHLLPHLQIHLPSVLSEYEQKKKDEVTRIRKIGVVSLNASATLSTNSEVALQNQVDGGGLKGESATVDQVMVGGSSILSGSASRVNRQYLNLLLACLESNIPWDDIFYILGPYEDDDISIKTMENMLEACCGIYPPIGKGLCNCIEAMVNDLYNERMKLRSDLDQVHHLNIADTKDTITGDECIQGQLSFSSFRRKNNLSVHATLSDMAKALFRPLRCVVATGSIALNPILYSKILRMVDSFLIHGDGSDLDFDEYTNYLFEAFLVPSLCLFPFNTAISAELWSVLSALSSYPIRYRFYGSLRTSGLEKEALKGNVIRKPLAQVESEVESGREIRYRLRRVSMENVREMGRQIAKIANTNPLVVFTAILNQIESYDNLIFLMVDTFEFLTPYSLDVLGYCILSSLGGGDVKLSRTKTKDDGITTAQWLSSLASFVGAFYRKFPNVEVHGLLSHLLRKLSEGSVVELCVLQSLLKIAGGYGFADCTSIASLSPVQLEGRCGSLHLRRETSDFGVIEKFDSISSSKLRYAFQSTNFGAIFLILLAQIRYKLLNMNMKKIKLIGNALDSCQRTSYLLLTFITDSLEEESLNEDPSLSLYAKTLPNQRNLLHLHGLESDDIWTLSRPIFRGSLLNDPTVTLASFVDFQTVQDMISSCYNDFVSPILYCLFFTLSIYDITFPEDRYRLEINRLNREIDRLTKLQKGGKEAQGTISALAQAAASAGVTGRELKDAASFTKAHERELMRMKRVVDTLTADMIRQKSHVERINLLLDRDKAILFQSSSEHTIKCGIIRAFISECVSTRCRSSPDDAMYCSRFTMLLHTLDTPNFYTLFYFDTVIESVARVLFGVTEDEASNFSIFLEETWKNINLYRFEPNLYESVIQGKTGSLWPTESGIKTISHGDFSELYHRWHDSLAIVLLGALKASEYMYCRAALIVLSRLVKVFPTNARVGRKLMKALSRFQVSDFAMQDIKAMAQGYKSQLSKARDDGLWKEDQVEASLDRTGQQNERNSILENELGTNMDSSEVLDIDSNTVVQRQVMALEEGNQGSSSNPIKESNSPEQTIAVVHDDTVPDRLSEQSNSTELMSEPLISAERDAVTSSHDDEKSNTQNHEITSTGANGDHEISAGNKETGLNTSRVDTTKLGGRWEKADDSRGTKRKATDQRDYEPRRNAEMAQQRGRHRHYRRSY